MIHAFSSGLHETPLVYLVVIINNNIEIIDLAKDVLNEIGIKASSSMYNSIPYIDLSG